MLFSMLANLAEDRQGVATEQDADLAAAIARLNAEGIGADAVIDLLDHGLIAPVQTAHPTDTRRNAMIDHRNRIDDLMALKARGPTATPDGDRVYAASPRPITYLCHMSALRGQQRTTAL